MEAYKNSALPVELRVENLLGRMTLEEKAAQLCGDLPASFMAEGEVDRALLRERFPHGHGRFTQYSMVGLVDPARIARISNQVQAYFVEETRLGVPVALQTENLCGYPAAGGTLFPSMMNLASTWRPELAGQVGRIIGQESRAVGINSAMSPVIDVSRDPRWGRVYETFGEDPCLIAAMGVEYIKGMQADKTDGVACIAKHFLGYGETQGGLNAAVSRISPRELYEVFATPFEAAAKLADVSGMMASYSEINGLPVGMNPAIARTLLREVMGYRGVLTSDGAGVMKMYNFFHTARSYPEAGLLALKAGLETEIPVGAAFRQLPESVRRGELDEDQLDQAVRRVLTVKFEYGLFESPYVDEGRVSVAMTSPPKQELAEEVARQSIILLENSGVLPLKPGTKLALVGPHAHNARYPISGYTYPAYIEMLTAGSRGEGEVTFHGMADEAGKARAEAGDNPPMNPFAAVLELLGAQDRARLTDLPTLLEALGAETLKEVLEQRFPLHYAQGCTITGKDAAGIPEAVRAALASDVVVMACGGNCGWVNVTGGEGKDRCTLDLPGIQQQLLEALVATGKPVVLVLYGPGAFALPWAAEHCAAVLQAWMPGLGAGRAVADVLDGAVNPGGKLAVTVPRSVGQIPVTYNHRMGSGYASGGDETVSLIFSGGYVDMSDRPLYPFGFGRSYTSFSLSGFEVPRTQIPTDGALTVRCRVTNTGGTAGDEVVQLYTHFRDAHVIRPVKQLAGFARVSLPPGGEKTVEFQLSTAQLGYYNQEMAFVVEPGRLELMVGTSAHHVAHREEVLLTGSTVNVMGRREYICGVRVFR